MDQATIDRLVRDGLPIVDIVARRLERRLHGLVQLDELLAVGRLALLGIARAHDDALSRFAPYCAVRLKWAMLDAVRRDTHGRVAAMRARALVASEEVVE